MTIFKVNYLLRRRVDFIQKEMMLNDEQYVPDHFVEIALEIVYDNKEPYTLYDIYEIAQMKHREWLKHRTRFKKFLGEPIVRDIYSYM